MKKILIAILVIATIASCHKKTGAGKASASGASLFATNCAGCHGSNGMNGKAPHLDHAGTEDVVVGVITNGKGTKMPAFASKLSAADIKSIAGYVMAIEKSSTGKK